MDPIESIATALALGAAAGLKPTVEKVIKDAYDGLKALILRKYPKVDVNQLETDPGSKGRRAVVTEGLEKGGAHNDAELLLSAANVLETVRSRAPETAGVVGVDLKDVEGVALTIRRVIASGTGVNIEHAKLAGDITIEDVRAGEGEQRPKA
jgi:hypothetical protein